MSSHIDTCRCNEAGVRKQNDLICNSKSSNIPTVNITTLVILKLSELIKHGDFYGGLDLATTEMMQRASGEFKADASEDSQGIPLFAIIIVGFVILTLTGNGNGSCDPAVDQKRIDIIPTPVVYLIPSADYCTNEPGILLSATALENYRNSELFSKTWAKTKIHFKEKAFAKSYKLLHWQG